MVASEVTTHRLSVSFIWKKGFRQENCMLAPIRAAEPEQGILHIEKLDA